MIDTKLLRQKILDLAIRGKLVPQDPADEPASELLKKIKDEKEALVKAGKIKKDKYESFIFKGDDNRYYETIDGKTTDITEEIPFDLPDNWCWSRIGTAFFLQAGKSISANEIHEIKDEKYCYPCYGGNGKRGFVDRFNTSGEHPLIGRQGALCGNINFASGEFYSTEHAVVVDVFAKCSAELMALFLTALNLNQYSTATAQPGLSVNVINSLLLPLPPLAEQQRIVEQVETLLGYVDIIDADAEDLDKSITLAKQKILDLAIRGKLVPQDPTDEPASELLKKIKAEKEALIKAGKLKKDKHESFIFKSDDSCYHENIDGKVTDITDEIPFDLPESWCWCRLNHVALLADGDWIESKDQAHAGFRLIQTGNIGKCKFLPHDERARYISKETFSKLNCTEIFPGDCLISRLPDPLGRACIVPFSHERMITAVDCTITRPFKAVLFTLYFMYFTGTTIYSEYVEKNATGSTRKRISRANLDKTLLPLPPLAEQKRIVSQVEKLFSVMETMRG